MARETAGKAGVAAAIRHRINAGRVALNAQVGLFKRLFGDVVSEWKYDQTRVTFADLAVSEKIFAELGNAFGNDDFCSEETDPDRGEHALDQPFAWVLDPVDGTNNFFYGVPMCAISLALLHRGEPLYGFVYDFARDVVIEGGPGFPLLDGGKRAAPRGGSIDSQSLVATHFPIPPAWLEFYAEHLAGLRLRAIGSSALSLAWTAVGRLDACVDFKVKVWDIAAACALLEAGGCAYGFPDGCNPFPLKSFGANAPELRIVAGPQEWVEKGQRG